MRKKLLVLAIVSAIFGAGPWAKAQEAPQGEEEAAEEALEEAQPGDGGAQMEEESERPAMPPQEMERIRERLKDNAPSKFNRDEKPMMGIPEDARGELRRGVGPAEMQGPQLLPFLDFLMDHSAAIEFDEGQVKALNELRLKHRIASIKLRADLDTAALMLKTAMDPGAPKFDEARTQAKELASASEKLHLLSIDGFERAFGIVTAAQREKLKQLRPKKNKKRPMGRR